LAGGPAPGWGTEPQKGTKPLHELLGYHGLTLDPTGCFQMGERAYGADTGRWLSHDPVGGTASLSGYDYADNDPVNVTDPDGRFGKPSLFSWDGMQQQQQMLSLASRPSYTTVGNSFSSVNAGWQPVTERQQISQVLNYVPVVGWAKSGVEAATGYDVAAGRYLSQSEQITAAAGFVAGGVAAIGGYSAAVRAPQVMRSITNTTALARGTSIPAASVAAKTGLSRSAVVSTERAEQLLIKYGRNAEEAKDYVASFNGPITARIVSPGESFLRYTDVATSKGSFLTKSVFGSPAEAVEGLYLKPYGNSASLLQDVSASGRSIILEGGVANGSAQQSLIVNRNAFQFGTGTGF
jgi:RHS repeat-associated protein